VYGAHYHHDALGYVDIARERRSAQAHVAAAAAKVKADEGTPKAPEWLARATPIPVANPMRANQSAIAAAMAQAKERRLRAAQEAQQQQQQQQRPGRKEKRRGAKPVAASAGPIAQPVAVSRALIPGAALAAVNQSSEFTSGVDRAIAELRRAGKSVRIREEGVRQPGVVSQPPAPLRQRPQPPHPLPSAASAARYAAYDDQNRSPKADPVAELTRRNRERAMAHEAARAAKQHDVRKAAQSHAPSWWPRSVEVGEPRPRPPSPATVSAANARLTELKAKLEGGEELTDVEMSDAAAIMELRKIWAERAVEAEAAKEAARAVGAPPSHPRTVRANIQRGGMDAAEAMTWLQP
jgi:hypothetical protein